MQVNSIECFQVVRICLVVCSRGVVNGGESCVSLAIIFELIQSSLPLILAVFSRIFVEYAYQI